MTECAPLPSEMSSYEQKRWRELQEYWEKKAGGSWRVLPPRAREAVENASDATKEAARKAGRAVVDATPSRVKNMAGRAADASLVPVAEGVARLLELVNDWTIELNDPDRALRFHQEQGREVTSLEDLKSLDLNELEEMTKGMTLRWRTLGAGEGAALGSLALIPVPGVGSVAAISSDLVVMQVLTGGIATRICYAYGFDADDPEVRRMIERMVRRAYRDQSAKAGTAKKAADAFAAANGRVNWSAKLRDDHRIMAAVETLLEQLGNSNHVPVRHARMGMPVVSIVAGAGTNSYVLGDVVAQSEAYAATKFLAHKYGLPLPSNLQEADDVSDG